MIFPKYFSIKHVYFCRLVMHVSLFHRNYSIAHHAFYVHHISRIGDSRPNNLKLDVLCNLEYVDLVSLPRWSLDRASVGILVAE